MNYPLTWNRQNGRGNSMYTSDGRFVCVCVCESCALRAKKYGLRHKHRKSVRSLGFIQTTTKEEKKATTSILFMHLKIDDHNSPVWQYTIRMESRGRRILAQKDIYVPTENAKIETRGQRSVEDWWCHKRPITLTSSAFSFRFPMLYIYIIWVHVLRETTYITVCCVCLRHLTIRLMVCNNCCDLHHKAAQLFDASYLIAHWKVEFPS